MTNSKEIPPQFRDQLEVEIKDTFLCAIGQNALTEMTKQYEDENPVLYRYTNYIADYTSHQNGTCNIADPFSMI